MRAACLLKMSLATALSCLLAGFLVEANGADSTLPGTGPLTWNGDLAARMLDGAHRFVDQQITDSVAARAAHWQRDFSSPEAYWNSLAKNRDRLAVILGMRDGRAATNVPRILTPAGSDSPIAAGTGYAIYETEWNAIGKTIRGSGLLLLPTQPITSMVVYIPDADQSPEAVCGLVEGIDPMARIPLRLAEQGCLVVVPTLVDRSREAHRFTEREYLYRSAYELGRHLIGYEIQKVLSIVDWYDARRAAHKEMPIAVWGYGEGGMLALYASALDPRIQVTCVSGFFSNRNNLWQEPIDRNVFGLWEQFGDAEIATMVAPRALIIDACVHPTFELPPGTGGAPAKLMTPADETVTAEVKRARDLLAAWPTGQTWLQLTSDSKQLVGSSATWKAFTTACGLPSADQPPATPRGLRARRDPQGHAQQIVSDIDRHTQEVLRESQYVRQEYFRQLNPESLDTYAKTIEPYREHFRHEVIGHFNLPLEPPHPRTRKLNETDKVIYYEVVLDTLPDVFAYGILCLPKDVAPGERRPVVVCQHGLEGRPQSVIGEPGFEFYKAFATRLAERGFITFAPQNLYIFEDRFRSLQRKLYPLKKTLFSIIVPQHQQIVDWLQAQPFVDPERVAFYGLSYGGKTAMRVPPLVTDYCLSICSADFNEWVDKNASTRNPRSYVNSGEYEIFEWDLGSTFNYAEMAALIAPRPFMVERGHFDGVSDDWTVGWEFAKILHLYQARLHLMDRTEIEWFVGPHSINGQGTFRFLHRHLQWPERE